MNRLLPVSEDDLADLERLRDGRVAFDASCADHKGGVRATDDNRSNPWLNRVFVLDVVAH
jgi:hypothetical protein